MSRLERVDAFANGSLEGIYPAFPGNITWMSVNLAGSYKRAAGMAIHIGVGNLAGGRLSPSELEICDLPSRNLLTEHVI